MTRLEQAFFGTIKGCKHCVNFAAAYFTEFGWLVGPADYNEYVEHLRRDHGIKPWEGSVSP